MRELNYKIDYEGLLDRVRLKIGPDRTLDLAIEIMRLLQNAGLSGDESLAMVMFTGETICCTYMPNKNHKISDET